MNSPVHLYIIIALAILYTNAQIKKKKGSVSLVKDIFHKCGFILKDLKGLTEISELFQFHVRTKMQWFA